MLRTAAATLVALTLVIQAHAAPVERYSGFVGFGDSLSDKGRVPGFLPPSLDGRFTNGRTWMEIVGQAFADRGQANVNLALGGATAGPVNDNDPEFLVGDALVGPRDPANPDDLSFFSLGTFDRQITTYIGTGFETMVGDNPLVGLLFGGNDFLQAGVGFNPLDVAANLLAGVRRITTLDPKYNDFLILNLPDLASLPANADASAAERATISNAVTAFNLALGTGLGALEAELELASGGDYDFQVLDYFALQNALMAQAPALGLRLDTPCTTSVSSPLQPFNFCPTPEAAESFFFVDGVHPNSVVHGEIGKAALALLSGDPAPVPLPAGLPFLLTGLAAFGVLRHRRTA